jgi:hypothetical protein
MSVKTPERLLADELKTDPAVAAVVGDRIYPVIAPATAAIPFVVWRRSAVQREQTLSGPAGMPSVTLQFDMYAETYEAVRELADRCRLVLDGWGGSLGNWISVRHVSLIGESDGFVSLAGGDLPPVYSVSQTYTVLWQEIST